MGRWSNYELGIPYGLRLRVIHKEVLAMKLVAYPSLSAAAPMSANGGRRHFFKSNDYLTL